MLEAKFGDNLGVRGKPHLLKLWTLMSLKVGYPIFLYYSKKF